MLSRTADHLFWMSRYTERAENTARMLDVNYQTSLLPQSAAVAQVGWQGLLSISELLPAYAAQHGEITPQRVMEFMVKDEDNPSSIVSCLKAARENARAVRGSLTTEAWETQNQTWLEVNRMLKAGQFERDPGQFFEWVKFRSHLSRGVTVGTMLMDEALHFMRLGTFLERADNTARLVDVKFHAVQSDFFGAATEQDQEYDFYHWSAILRSVSGFEIYRKVYRDVIKPERVADLLILRPDMPRSLHASMNEVLATWKWWPTTSRRDHPPRRQAARRPEMGPHRRDPGHRAACVPDAVPGPGERAGRAHQPRLPDPCIGVSAAGMTPQEQAAALLAGGRCHEARPVRPEPARLSPHRLDARHGPGAGLRRRGRRLGCGGLAERCLPRGPGRPGPGPPPGRAAAEPAAARAGAAGVRAAVPPAFNARDRATLLHYGFCLEHTGDLDGAVRLYREAIAQEPDFMEAHVDLAGVLWRVEDHAGALAHAQRAVEIAPQHPYAVRILGTALLHLNRLDEAQAQLRRALQNCSRAFPGGGGPGVGAAAGRQLEAGWAQYSAAGTTPCAWRARAFTTPRWNGRARSASRSKANASSCMPSRAWAM
jgi:uncharacterized alpha-E superfamily protein/tetratricopeptide (TPR) repeat protein